MFRLVELCDGTRGSSRSRDLIERALQLRSKQNGSLCVPGSTTPCRRIANIGRRASFKQNSLEFATSKIAYGPAIPGPKWERRPVGSRQDSGTQTVQLPYPERGLSLRVAGRENENSPVRRKRDRPTEVSCNYRYRPFLRRNYRPNHLYGFAGLAIIGSARQGRRQQSRRRDRPGQTLPRLPVQPLRCGNPWLRASFRNPVQLGCQIARILPTVFWVFRQAFLDHSLHRRWSERLQLRDRSRLCGQNRGDQTCTALSAECRFARRHFVDHFSQCENIRA